LAPWFWSRPAVPPTSAVVPPVSPASVPQEAKAGEGKADEPEPPVKATPQTSKKPAKPKGQDPAIGAWERARREAIETPLPVPPAATQPHYATPT
jgi:hypothetical protein